MKVIILLCSLFLALQANIGKITTIQGEVKVLRDSKNLQGESSFILENKDIVNTGDNSRTQLLFNDETLISLGENSTFSIEEYLVDETKPNDSEMSLQISKGILKAITGKIGKINPNKFKLKTRSATIGIRGTIFFVQIMEDGSEYLVCKKGAIIVESPQGVTYIPEGFYVLIQTDGSVGVPQPFTEQELKRIENETGNVESKEYITVDDEKYTPIIKTETPPTNGPEGGVPKNSSQGAGEDFINHINKNTQEIVSNAISLPNITVDAPTTITVTSTVQNLIENSITSGLAIAIIDARDDDSDIILTLSDAQNYIIAGNTVQLTQAGADLVNSGNDLPAFTIDANGVTSNTINISTILVDDPAIITIIPLLEEITENSVTAGTVVATIDAYDEDDDIIVSISDTTNYALVEYSEQATQKGKILTVGGKRLIQVQLTQAGADYVNAGNDLPPFTVSVNGITSDEFSLPPTVEVDDPAVIEILSVTSQLIKNSAKKGSVIATFNAYDEDTELTITVSNTDIYVIIGNEVQLTQTGADIVNSGSNLPAFTITVNGIISEVIILPATTSPTTPTPEPVATSTKTATFNVLSSAKREPNGSSNFVGANSIYKTMNDSQLTIAINNGTLSKNINDLTNAEILLDHYDVNEDQILDLNNDPEQTTITVPQPTLSPQTASYSSYSNVYSSGTTKMFADDMQEFFILENSYLETIVEPNDYQYTETTLFGIRTNDSQIPADIISKYTLPENTLTNYGTNTDTYINWGNRTGTSFYMDDENIIIENYKLTVNNDGNIDIASKLKGSSFDFNTWIGDTYSNGAIFGTEYQGMGTNILARDNNSYSTYYTTGKYRDSNYSEDVITNQVGSDFKGITYLNDRTSSITFTLDRGVEISNGAIDDIGNTTNFSGSFTSLDAVYINDDFFNVLTFSGQNSYYESVQSGWLIAIDTGSLNTDNSDDFISWGYWGADYGTVGTGGDDIQRAAWVATSLNNAIPDNISAALHNGTYSGPMMGIYSTGVDTFIDPSNSSLNITFNFDTPSVSTSIQINGSTFTPTNPITSLSSFGTQYTAEDTSYTNEITGEFYDSGSVSIGKFKLIDDNDGVARGVFKIKKQ